MISEAVTGMACPVCGGKLSLEQTRRRDERVWKGEIVCSENGHVFPVVTGIPVLLPPGMLADWTHPFTRILMGDFRASVDQKRRMIDPLEEYARVHGTGKMKEVFAAYLKGEHRPPEKHWESPVDGAMIREGAHRKRKRHVDRHLRLIDEQWGRSKTLREEVGAVAQLKPARLLDVCCGGGFFATSLIREYNEYGQLFALDIDYVCTRLLESTFDRYGVSDRCIPIVADVRALPFPTGYFDLVNSRFGEVHVTGYSAGLREILRVLKPGGHFVCTNRISRKIPHKAVTMDEVVQISRHADLYLDKEQYLQTLAKTGFETETVEDIEEAFLAVSTKPNTQRSTQA